MGILARGQTGSLGALRVPVGVGARREQIGDHRGAGCRAGVGLLREGQGYRCRMSEEPEVSVQMGVESACGGSMRPCSLTTNSEL